ncbi:hypothetical protein EB796_013484 [Bugula neritina]|uniref:Uncharacterized protein n=1 Tax=Bugula neritina TaxID=10212 RepID=A0A7J7JFH6_BUGNE|nr:hypothetical protein EB796_017578 [Bugula neritina]KAF6028215.1 hypothetical protein EB796_013484 [Bugula neritina]
MQYHKIKLNRCLNIQISNTLLNNTKHNYKTNMLRNKQTYIRFNYLQGFTSVWKLQFYPGHRENTISSTTYCL